MYKRVAQGWMKHIDFILLDLVCLHLAFVIAYILRHGTDGSPYMDQTYRGMAVVMTIVDALVSVAFNTMHNVLKRGYYHELAITVKHSILVFVILTAYLFSTQKGEIYSRIVLYLTLCFHTVLGYGVRLLWKAHLRQKGVRRKARSLLVVSDEASAAELIRNLKAATNETFHIAGLILTNRAAKGETFEGVSVVTELKAAGEYICRKWVDEVFINVTQTSDRPFEFIEQCRQMGIVVHENLASNHERNEKQFIEKIDGYTVLTTSINYASPLQALIKRALDIMGGITGCIITLIIIVFVGPKIKKESPGPVFFKQERIGKNGKRFMIIKLRSMYLDAEERKRELVNNNRIADGMMFKLDFDPRIIGNEILPDGTKKTGIGEFIRKTSLDEFPQFWNVLKGDMSLVGTRPPTVDEWEKYKLHHRARMAMKPGITGMWQISGRSNITDFEEVVKLDTQYITNWSMGLDCRILAKTVAGLGKMDGAM